jgi:hypothetical protein
MGCCESKDAPPEGMQMDMKPLPRTSLLYKNEDEEMVFEDGSPYESEDSEE